MKRITQKKVYGKQKSEAVVHQLMEGDLDTRVELIQRLIPLGLLHVQEQLQGGRRTGGSSVQSGWWAEAVCTMG